jgi:RNA polymerase sigma-54 factor
MSMTQKLSPQQIQFIKLLQVPTIELDARIEEELEINPALEEGPDDEVKPEQEEREETKEDSEEINIEDYLQHDDHAGYKMQGDGPGDEEDKDMPLASHTSMSDLLNVQLGFLKLDERQRVIAEQLVGSIEGDGYIRRELEAIINDLAFSQYVETDLDELEEILRKVQDFEPAGIGARSLQECLLLQLERRDQMDADVIVAVEIIDSMFTEFTKKHYKKILAKLDIDEEQLKSAISVITRLNPKPGGSMETGNRAQYNTPDFMLSKDGDDLRIALNSKNAPELKVSRSYSEMLDTYSKSDKKDKKIKETVTFVKQKLDAAKWFIDAIRQRQETLLKTMNTIATLQKEFFLTGDEAKLRPMILKDIADRIKMDISTVSRVANSKSVQTEFGTYPLKYFFSESISTDTGEDVRRREVKPVLSGIIDAEEKRKPLSDDKLCGMLKDKGYNIARRTVAKYREQLNIPVARLRKEL